MLLSKLRSILIRLIIPIINFPVRLLRLASHLFYPFLSKVSTMPQYQIIKDWYDWFLMIPFYVIDLFGLAELYEILNELINWNIRDLSSHEIIMIDQIFKSNSLTKRVRVHAQNNIAKKLRIAYVSFRQINFSERISNDILIHEMVHIWQYKIFGAVYIYFAWKAQMSEEGYDYGSAPALIKAVEQGKLFHEFNFEQQADIIQDYYKSRNFKSHGLQGIEMAAYNAYHEAMNQLV